MGRESLYKRVVGRGSLYFLKKDWWILQHAKRRAKVQNISLSQEMVDGLRRIYMLERRQSGEKVVIDKYLYNIMVLQKDELIKKIQSEENEEK